MSNFLSISRILLLPFIIILLQKPATIQNHIILLFLIVIAILSDYFDGLFARKYNQVSVIGKILDPLADKICIGVLVLFAVLYRDLPVWLAILIIGRDLMIILMSILIISKKEIVVESNKIGKFTVFFLALLVVSYVFTIKLVQLPLTILVILCIVISLISYGKRSFVMLKKNDE